MQQWGGKVGGGRVGGFLERFRPHHVVQPRMGRYHLVAHIQNQHQGYQLVQVQGVGLVKCSTNQFHQQGFDRLLRYPWWVTAMVSNHGGVVGV